jgi:magnesium transporter
MAKSEKARLQHTSSPPGTLVHIGKKKREKAQISFFRYNAGSYEEKELSALSELPAHAAPGDVWWINIDGLHDISLIEAVGKRFHVHELILEDILDTNQRPKVEETENNLSLIVKMLHYNNGAGIRGEQVSLVIGTYYVISFQEYRGDVFEAIRDRIRGQKGRIRRMGADYLGYCLIDALVDNYFLILENLGDRIENLEETVMKQPTPDRLKHIYALKRELLYLRKSVWPMREIINNLQRGGTHLLSPAISLYLKDLYDHIAQVIDTTETFREMVSGLLDIYLSSLSNKMNEIMKVLTIIATIFIPITFIVGVYGMNFPNMPEIHWKWGYLAVWGLIVGIVIVLLLFFKKKKWL